jgi:hypothetical protein
MADINMRDLSALSFLVRSALTQEFIRDIVHAHLSGLLEA